MGRSLAHRGPDGEGIFVGPNVALAHRRLSIIDLSPDGRQPMTTADGRYTIVFNGEIYNYLEIRAELETKYRWTSKSDTEVILHAFETWGPAALPRFNGMFAFALYDAQERTLFCARDRLGIKPFYYTFDGREFVFASEIKGLLAAGWKAEPNHTRIADYLARGLYDHTDETFFSGIRKLPAGHYAILRQGEKPAPKSYWDLAQRAAATVLPKDEREIIEEYKKLLQDSIKLRLRSDVPVGVTLSSGLDSSGLTAHLRAALPESDKLSAFTSGYAVPEFDESPGAKELADLFRHPWQRSNLDADEVPRLLEKTLYYQDEPFGGVPQLGFFKLHELARQRGVTVLLEGHGVEECISGYPIYFYAHWADEYRSGRLPRLLWDWRSYHARLGESYGSIFGNFRKYLYGARGRHVDFTKQSYSSVLPADYQKAFAAPAPDPKPFGSQLSNELYRNLAHDKLPRALRFQDRISMSHGREVRLPYLDYRLVELSYALPSRLKIRGSRDKIILAESLKGLVPQDRITKPKRYIVTPQTHWLHGALRPWVESVIGSESFRSRPCFDQAGIGRAVKAFYAEPQPKNSFFIWQLLNLEAWFRMFIDRTWEPMGPEALERQAADKII
jgi:asparagine synthase (glutamine-hydrolysing)